MWLEEGTRIEVIWDQGMYKSKVYGARIKGLR